MEQPLANPKQQADKLADLKRRYQQDVLGLTQQKPAEPEA
jgi:hypothetical protein